MFTSEIDIVNAGLSRIGWTELLQELSLSPEDADGSQNPALEQGRLWYAKLRDDLLRSAPWPFATLREALVQLPDEKRSDWEYAYAIPTDSLAIREVLVAGIRNPRPDERPAHRIEARRGAANDQGVRPVIGQVLLSDEEAIEIRHTVRLENVAAFPVDFGIALSRALASVFAPALVKGDLGEKLRDACANEAEWFRRRAWAAARNEENPDPAPTNTFEAARR